MDEGTKYSAKYLELMFIFVILASVLLINFFLPHKLAFLNFYYLPIMIAGYFLGKRASVTGSLFCILTVIIFALLSPSAFYIENNTMHIALNLLLWGCFLILAGIVVGSLQEKLTFEYQHTSQLNKDLKKNHEELKNTNFELKKSNQVLEEKTHELEENKATIEILKDKVENALYSTMDSTVAKLVIQGRIRNEKRSISVLFTDLVGFTDFSDENRPESVIESLNKYLVLMEPPIVDYWGHIDKYMGDGIMCEFGAPVNYDNHALLAVLAGIKMQEKLSQSELPWKMRIGIGSGYTITGFLGIKRQTYTAIGDVVNVAHRLEEICTPGKVYIDEQTYQAVKDFIDTEKVRSFGRNRDEDLLIFDKIKTNDELLQVNKNDINLLSETGKLLFDLKEVTKAMEYFERALAIDPENNELKLLYADASLNKDNYEKVGIKGKKKRISVHEVVGIKDVMMDRKKISLDFYQKYNHLEKLIEVPDDVILPVEALDGTIGHSKLVAIISYVVAEQLGLTEQEKRNVLLAGYLEDIGKRIVPHYILNRKGSLTEAEIKEVEKHPMESTRMLRLIGYDTNDVLEIVVNHHERYNGEGYPFQKKGEEIPVGARITAVVDSFSALLSNRSYREGWELNAALAEIERGTKGGKFDPKISEVLIKLMS